MAMKKVVVIVGAGASFDVHNRSMPAPDPRLRPPLARDLFDQRFWSERAPYPGAVVLGSTLGELAQSATTFDLEEHLTSYANRPR